MHGLLILATSFLWSIPVKLIASCLHSAYMCVPVLDFLHLPPPPLPHRKLRMVVQRYGFLRSSCQWVRCTSGWTTTARPGRSVLWCALRRDSRTASALWQRLAMLPIYIIISCSISRAWSASQHTNHSVQN